MVSTPYGSGGIDEDDFGIPPGRDGMSGFIDGGDADLTTTPSTMVMVLKRLPD
jgi:hypothetical protein